MARWSFHIRNGKTKEVGETYNAQDAEKKRRELLQQYGERLVVKIDGRETPSKSSLV